MASTDPLLPHLFRTEYRKVVSVLCKHFGFAQMEMAEDIASETFLAAAQTWGIEGPPPQPTAWLYHVAKNKARTALQRDQLFRNRISPEIRKKAANAAGDQASAEQAAADRIALDRASTIAGDQTSADPSAEIDLSPQSIDDSQLQMMFAICHPSIPPEAQIGLSLRILCGFGIEEIADAFLSNKETINKRLFRAREKLREEKIRIELPGPAAIDARLGTVLTTIYLLFNEGYYSESSNDVLRKDLCLEAVRLCHMLTRNPATDQPRVNALLALMCFHASRFDARVSKNGEIILYDHQDQALWNTDLISQGGYYLSRSARGETLSTYHLEATIAYWSTQKTDTPEKWEQILQLYNRLLRINYSPIAALNRTYALARANGKEEAIVEAEKLKLTDSPYYFALLGELYTGIDNGKAKQHFQRAMGLARTAADRGMMERRWMGYVN